jgi:hypothetical protein
VAGSFSDFTELELLDHLFGAATYTPPGTLHISLFTAAPSDSGGGTEVTGGSYARVAVTNNATNWPAASGGAKANGTVITFPTPSANWGTVVAFGVHDASSGGNLIAWADLTTNRTINNGDGAPKFAVGDLDVTLT